MAVLRIVARKNALRKIDALVRNCGSLIRFGLIRITGAQVIQKGCISDPFHAKAADKNPVQSGLLKTQLVFLHERCRPRDTCGIHP